MKHFKCLAVAAGALLISANLFSQTVKMSIPGKEGMFPADVEFVPGTATTSKGNIKLPGKNGTVVNVSELISRQQEKDVLGMEHIRYQQTYLGIPVENAYEIVHLKNGSVVRQNGKLVETFNKQLTASPSIGEATALQYALASVAAQVYKWQSADEETFIKNEQQDPSATFYPKGSLVFYSGEEEVVPGAMRLAYKFDIYAQQPLSRQIVFVDAKTGEILGKRELIHEVNAVGTGVTVYSGPRTITADSYNGSYRLRETGRGNGIQTFDLNKGTSYSAAVDFTDSDNYWNNINSDSDHYAIDAHWGAEQTYDYYKNKYNRNSIDNAGYAIKSYVHYSTNYFNAFWDGSRMTYGDGSTTRVYRPLTALDVCGHEITHGLTTFTSNLTYSGESGALNEGFSDIFGTAVEFYARPENANWIIGGDFLNLRDMSNPNAYGDPDTYLGTNWYTGTDNNTTVHTNSGVLNYWFYLLTTGGTGTNDNGTAYDVTGIGIDKAAAIAFRTNTVYLTATSKYADARTYSIQAATDLFGAGSAEVIQTTNAWTAVGVNASTTTPTCTDSYESNESLSAAKTIAVNTNITAKIGTSTDKDYFKFTTTSAAPKLKVTISNLPADYDLRLYKSTGSQLAASQNSGTTTESITYNTATAAATYYVYVYGYNGATSASCYNLLVTTSGTNLIESESRNTGLVKDVADKVSEKLVLQPVPASSFTVLTFGSKTVSTASIVVTDITGAILKKVATPVSTGTNQYRLNVSDLKNGVYFVKLVTLEGESQIQKLVVQH